MPHVFFALHNVQFHTLTANDVFNNLRKERESPIPAQNIARSITKPGVQPPVLSEGTQQRRRGPLATE